MHVGVSREGFDKTRDRRGTQGFRIRLFWGQSSWEGGENKIK
jgi:hypothetical protein